MAVLTIGILVSVMGVEGTKADAASPSNKNVVVSNKNRSTKIKSVTKVQIASPSIKNGKLTIYRGTGNVTIQLKTKVTVMGKGISSKTKKYNAVSYKSSNVKVVSISSTGKITAKKNGTAKITITSAANTKKKASINITVKPGVGAIQATVDQQSDATIEAGKTVKIETSVSNVAKRANKTVTYQSNNKKVATVSKSGIITAVKPGTATITVTPKYSTGVKTILKVTVKEAQPEEITQDDTMEQTITIIPCELMNLQIGESKQATYIVEPATAMYEAVTYSSEDTSIATVNEQGVVTGIKKGSTRITITSANNTEINACFDVVVGQEGTGLVEE